MDLNQVLPTAELTPLPAELRSSSYFKTSQIDINTNGSNILFPFVVISLLYLVLWIIPLSLYPFVVQFRQIVVLFLYNMNINSPLCCFVSFYGELYTLCLIICIPLQPFVVTESIWISWTNIWTSWTNTWIEQKNTFENSFQWTFETLLDAGIRGHFSVLRSKSDIINAQ